jgi:hypothetical protein
MESFGSRQAAVSRKSLTPLQKARQRARKGKQMAFKRKAFKPENVTKEFEPVGERRIRIIDNRAIDIREYVEADTFTGFTRKGIRVNREEAKQIVKAMQAFIDAEEVHPKYAAEHYARVEKAPEADPIPMQAEYFGIAMGKIPPAIAA